MEGLLDPILTNPIYKATSLGLGIVGLAISLALLFWLYRDAQRRGTATYIWLALGLVLTVGAMVMGFAASSFGFGPVGLLPLFGLVFFVIIYLIVRPSEFLEDIQEREMSMHLLEAELEKGVCHSCGAAIESDFIVCPVCTKELRVQCSYCGRPVKRAWHVCPYCKARPGQ